MKKFLVLVLLTLIISGCGTEKKKFLELQDGDEFLTYEEADRLARRLDDLKDSIIYRLPYAGRAQLAYWTYEMVPLFEYEGITDKANMPEIVDLIPLNGAHHMHVGGRSNCGTYAILNARYSNPVSSWHDGNYVQTLAHELAHLQQRSICIYTPSERLETAAEVSSLEVLAALANKGNKYAALSLVSTMRSSLIQSAYYLSEKEGKQEQFQLLIEDVSDYDSLSRVSWEKSLAYWSEDMDKFIEITEKYWYEPPRLIFNSFSNGNEVFIAINTGTKSRWNRGDYLELDDLYLFLSNVDEIIPEMNRKHLEDDKDI